MYTYFYFFFFVFFCLVFFFCVFYFCFFFFFFQAEDGIRDTSVTGVQTCALPISQPASHSASSLSGAAAFFFLCGCSSALGLGPVHRIHFDSATAWRTSIFLRLYPLDIKSCDVNICDHGRL